MGRKGTRACSGLSDCLRVATLVQLKCLRKAMRARCLFWYEGTILQGTQHEGTRQTVMAEGDGEDEPVEGGEGVGSGELGVCLSVGELKDVPVLGGHGEGLVDGGAGVPEQPHRTPLRLHQLEERPHALRRRALHTRAHIGKEVESGMAVTSVSLKSTWRW